MEIDIQNKSYGESDYRFLQVQRNEKYFGKCCK